MRTLSTALAAAWLLAICAVTAADEAAKQGRAIFDKHRDAVVTVQLVVKTQMSFPGATSTRDNEMKAEATGTVIDPTGLTVLSLSQTDPSSIIETIMQGAGDAEGFKMESEVRDVKILLSDGSEIPAEVILRDKELDMAFVRPSIRPEDDFPYVDLTSAGSPEILDEVITINRLGTVAGRVHSVSVERIDAIATKPRRFYIPGKDPTNTNLGSPAFTLDGKPVGVFLVRAIKDTASGARSMFGGMDQNVATILLPASDVLGAAEQAPPFKD